MPATYRESSLAYEARKERENIAAMERRVAAGLDPLTGRPMQTKGEIAWRKGVLCDETGREVRLSEHGDWVYA